MHKIFPSHFIDQPINLAKSKVKELSSNLMGRTAKSHDRIGKTELVLTIPLVTDYLKIQR